MKEIKDQAIKLFGKEILLPEIGVKGERFAVDDEFDTDKDLQRDNSPHPMEENETEDDPKTPPIIEENGNEKPTDAENDEDSSDQKTLKKPDKILPCPRCNSMDTKFCYYNNYNVNQPRHFCKACHRYWTAGGSMRNVPVGAGRRKNKNLSSNFRQITISEALTDKVISFGPNSVFRKVAFGVEKEKSSDCSSGSSLTTTSNSIEGSKADNLTNQIPCLQGYPWPYPAIPNPNPGFCPPGYSIPFFPIPYWVPWIPPPSGTNQNLLNLTTNSPLGKHSRNGNLLNQNNPESKETEEPKSCEKSILIPKTLRIDDPDEAAKSSIWATLGIKNDSINRKGLFFQAKCEEKKNYAPETPSSMRANPAAMSRSLNFLETA